MNRVKFYYEPTPEPIVIPEPKDHLVIKIENGRIYYLTKFDRKEGVAYWSKHIYAARRYSEKIATIAATNAGGVISQF